jgi:hypothetical protein
MMTIKLAMVPSLATMALLASSPVARGQSCQNQFTIDACNVACSTTGDVCGFLCGATRTACEAACDVVFDTCEFGCNACDVGCDVCCATTCFPGSCGACRDACTDCHNGCSGARGPCKNLCRLDCDNCTFDCKAGCPDCNPFRKIGESCFPAIDDCAPELICWPATFSDSSAFQCFPGEALDLSDDAVCRAMYSRDLHNGAMGANLALSYGAGASAGVVGSGSVEVGTVYDPDGCFGCYTQTCLGAESNVEVNAFAAVGQYESFDEFPGEGFVEIGSAGVAVVSLTVGQVISTDGQIVGATEALAFGPSLVPITLGLYFCNTAVNFVGCLDADGDLVEVVNNPPTARCTDLVTRLDLEVDSADLDINDGSFDPDGDAITHEQSPPGPYGPGEWLVTLTVTDSGGLSDSCGATVTVDQSLSPVLCGAGVGCTPGAPALGLIMLSLGCMRCVGSRGARTGGHAPATRARNPVAPNS